MVGKLDLGRLAAWRRFLETHATVVRTLGRKMQAEQGLPLTWYDVLAQLGQAPEGRLRMQVLAESVLLSRSGLTRLFDRMTTAGLVTRQSCPVDRRGTYAAITPEGKAALKRATPGHLRAIKEHFLKHLNEEDLRSLNGALSKVLDAEQGERTKDSDA